MNVQVEPQRYDVAIIGSGMAGSSLAMILARHGLKVIVFEAKSHPRFAIGESMILETSETMRAMAELYDVPELAYFSSENYLPLIGTSHGVKRHFSFLHHQVGETPGADRALQAVIPKEPHGHELHIYRQDSDAFLVNTAISYGATVLQQTPVRSVDIDTDAAVVHTEGASFQADYVVDAGGYRSILAEKYDLRSQTLQTHSRAIFCHMVDVQPFHQVSSSQQAYGLPFDVDEGTMHHVFEGGWLWVIPFDNHDSATNPLCSVGLMLDPRVYPIDENISPEDEFFSFIKRFPAIRAQFESAKAVRPWTRTGRIQYSAKQVVGERWALLGHAVGFVDPLFSKGLYSSLTSVSLLAHLLLEARQSRDHSRQAFIDLETKTLAYIRRNDRLIASAYKSFANARLWSVYATLWLLGAYTELVKLSSARTRYKTRAAYFQDTQGLSLVGGGFAAFDQLAEHLDEAVDAVDPSDDEQLGRLTAEMRAQLEATPWMPQAFKDVLKGKNHLPKRKLRLSLLRSQRGFMGQGGYREHFFGKLSTRALMSTFVKERLKYARGRLKRQRPKQLRHF